MVRSVAEDGLLRFARVGGPLLPTLDGAYCTCLLYTSDEGLQTNPACGVSFPQADGPAPGSVLTYEPQWNSDVNSCLLYTSPYDP